MKEVVKVSISGIAFSFDAEAYQVMKDYLDKLETGYAKKPDGREIVADIEARIAELILNEQESDNVVSRALAESVVAQLGFRTIWIRKKNRPWRRFRKGSTGIPTGRYSAAYAPDWLPISVPTPYG